MTAAPDNDIHNPYLSTLYLSTSEHIKFYNKEIVGIPESDRYNLTISKWTEFYQELEDAVSIFGWKSAVLIVTAKDAHNAPAEVKNVILYYTSITRFMVNSYCEILQDYNFGAGLGC